MRREEGDQRGTAVRGTDEWIVVADMVGRMGSGRRKGGVGGEWWS